MCPEELDIRGNRALKWRRKWQPTPVFLPGESQGQRSLVGCRLWGRTELGMTEATQQQQQQQQQEQSSKRQRLEETNQSGSHQLCHFWHHSYEAWPHSCFWFYQIPLFLIIFLFYLSQFEQVLFIATTQSLTQEIKIGGNIFQQGV